MNNKSLASIAAIVSMSTVVTYFGRESLFIFLHGYGLDHWLYRLSGLLVIFSVLALLFGRLLHSLFCAFSLLFYFPIAFCGVNSVVLAPQAGEPITWAEYSAVAVFYPLLLALLTGYTLLLLYTEYSNAMPDKTDKHLFLSLSVSICFSAIASLLLASLFQIMPKSALSWFFPNGQIEYSKPFFQSLLFPFHWRTLLVYGKFFENWKERFIACLT